MWRPKQLTIEQLEERRLAALALLQSGDISQSEIARQLAVSRQSVSRWSRQLHMSDSPDFTARPHTGRPSFLSAEQWEELLRLLQNGGKAAGFATDRWTLSRIAQVVQDQFGIRYNANYLSERLRALGWSVQVPDVAARERDEELVQAWLRGDWPRILKKLAVWEHKLPSSTRSVSLF